MEVIEDVYEGAIKIMNNTIDCNMSLTGFAEKPIGNEIIQINNEIARNQFCLTPHEFKVKIEKGSSFAPSVIDKVYKGAIKRIEQCWSSQQLYVLDFDSGENDISMLKKCEKLKLDIFHVYPSFSHTPEKPKFRVI